MAQDDDEDSSENDPEFLKQCEALIREWIEVEWVRRQEVEQRAAREQWPTAVKIVHLRSVVLTVETLAPSLDGISEHTLRRRLQQAGAKLSPGEMIHQARMEYAARLLRENRFTIAAAASMAGFDDQRYFAARFREHSGMTPRSYRQLNNESGSHEHRDHKSDTELATKWDDK